MENEQIEETQDEETQETSTEDVKTEEQGEENTKDWKAEALKYKAIAERKDKKLKSSEVNKPNTEQGGPTIEHSFLFAQGVTLDEMPIIEKAAKVLEIPLKDAYNDDMVQAKLNQVRNEAKVKANTLPPSGGSAPAPRTKTVSNMTDDEHRAFAEEKMKGAVNR